VTPEDRTPPDLLYHPEHDWARLDPATPDQATLGITWFAQDQLGDIVYWDVPAVGDTLVKDRPYTEVESVKAVSDVVAPLSGEVIAVNGALAAEPSRINADPYGDGWLVRVRLASTDELGALLDAEAYAELVGS
jgi:glycine cleavage system H protein